MGLESVNTCRWCVAVKVGRVCTFECVRITLMARVVSYLCVWAGKVSLWNLSIGPSGRGVRGGGLADFSGRASYLLPGVRVSQETQGRLGNFQAMEWWVAQLDDLPGHMVDQALLASWLAVDKVQRGVSRTARCHSGLGCLGGISVASCGESVGRHNHLPASQAGAPMDWATQHTAGCFLWWGSVAGPPDWFKGQDEVIGDSCLVTSQNPCWATSQDVGGFCSVKSASGMVYGRLSCRAMETCGNSAAPAQGTEPAKVACPPSHQALNVCVSRLFAYWAKALLL